MMTMMRLLLLLASALVACSSIDATVDVDGSVNSGVSSSYGVDVSWPMHHPPAEPISHKNTTSSIAEIRAEAYYKYMQGCVEAYWDDACWRQELERLLQNLGQPARSHNFTSKGYQKMRAPQRTYQNLLNFWNERHEEAVYEDDREELSLYTNHWTNPPRFLSLEQYPEMDQARADIIQEVQQVIEAWVGEPLEFTSLYGIREYTRGAMLLPHVDILPLVSSAIINVAQDVDEEWILEVIGHDGVAQNVTMEPGDMVLYESHSVIHGRPYALNGDSFSNVFIHFQPIGYAEQLMDMVRELTGRSDVEMDDMWSADRFFSDEVEDYKAAAMEPLPELPFDIDEGSEQAKRWREDSVYVSSTEEAKEDSDEVHQSLASTAASAEARRMAMQGNLGRLEELWKEHPASLDTPDEHGWSPLHEACQTGHTKVAEYLLSKGVDVNARSHRGLGATALWVAEQVLSPEHAAIKLLRQHGAESVGPVEEE